MAIKLPTLNNKIPTLNTSGPIKYSSPAIYSPGTPAPQLNTSAAAQANLSSLLKGSALNLNPSVIKTPQPSLTPSSAIQPVNSGASFSVPTAPTKSIYRVGNDIYDAATNTKIPDVATLVSQYKGAKDLGQRPDLLVSPTAINTDNLNQNVTDIKTPESTVPNYDLDPYYAGLKKQQEELKASADAMAAERKSLIDNYGANIDKYGQLGIRQSELLKESGFPEMQKNLADLMTQISAKNSVFERASVDNTGRAVMSSMIGGQEGLIRRQQAAEVGALTSMAQTIQGNIATAQQTVLDTVTMEFQPIENEINKLKAQIDLNYQDLTSAQKTQADQLVTVLNERTALVNQAKDDRNAVLSVGLEAAKNGATADVLNKIATAKTPMDALKAAGTYLQTNKFTPITGTNFVLNNVTGEITTIQASESDTSFGGGGAVTIPQNTLAYRNNNPGNLRFVGQAGATQGEGGFAKFATPEAGYEALKSQIQLDASRGLTLGQFINKYAPPTENDTNLYINQISQQTGANANTPISQINIDTLAQAMAKKESGTSISAGGMSEGQQYNQDILSSLDPIDRPAWLSATQEDRNVAQGLAEYRLDISKVSSLRGNKRQSIINLAQLINPEFDINSYAQVTQAKKSFAPGGKDYKNVVSLNTAIQHLKELNDASIELENGGLRLWNAIGNATLNAVGDPRITKFKTAATAVEGEMANVFKGTGATDQEIKQWRENISSSNSPAQLQTSINTLLELMRGRLEALAGSWETIINLPNQQPPQLISDKSMKILQEMGFSDIFSGYTAPNQSTYYPTGDNNSGQTSTGLGWQVIQ